MAISDILQISAIVTTVLIFVFGLLTTVIGYFFVGMHKQFLDKMKSFTDEIKDMCKQLIMHSERLRIGEKEFEKIADHQKEQDENINELSKNHGELDKRVIVLENKNS